MKTLVKVLFGAIAAISIIILFVLSLIQSNQINKINSDLSHVSNQLEILINNQDPSIITPTDIDVPDITGGPSDPTTTVAPSTSSETIKIKLYYKNVKNDPEHLNCEADTFVYRTIPKTSKVLTDTLNYMLTNKLTAEEKAFGLENLFEFGPDDTSYATRFEKFKIKSVSVNSTGMATITLEDPEYFSSGGSCRISELSSMFELTAKQFSTVDDIQFLPLDVMQP